MSILSQFKRDDASPVSHTTIGLLIALLILIVIGAVLIFSLLCVRRRQRARRNALPLYNEKHSSTSSISKHRRNKGAPESVLVIQEKKALFDNSSSPPSSPLPEIRITFPEEYDDSGKRTSGRVVVVRVGDTSMGLEPLSEDLPAYQRTESGRLYSIDLERIGGLTEKDFEKH